MVKYTTNETTYQLVDNSIENSHLRHEPRIRLLINRSFVGKKYRACDDFRGIKKGDILRYSTYTDCPQCSDKPFKEKCLNCQSRVKAHSNWKRVSLTLEQLINEHVINGHAITLWNHQYTEWKQKRTNKTAIASNLQALDFDNICAEIVAQHPLIQNYFFAVYPSASGRGCHALAVTDFAMTSKAQYKLFHDALLYAVRDLNPDTATKLGTASAMLYGAQNPKYVWTNTDNIMTRNNIQTVIDKMQHDRQAERNFITSLALKYADIELPKPKKSKSRIHEIADSVIEQRLINDDFTTFAEYSSLTNYILRGDIKIKEGYRNTALSKVAYNMSLRGHSYAEINDLLTQKGTSWGLSVNECQSVVKSASKGLTGNRKPRNRRYHFGMTDDTKKAIVHIAKHSNKGNGYMTTDALAIAKMTAKYGQGACKALIASVTGHNPRTATKYTKQLKAIGLVETTTRTIQVNTFKKEVEYYKPVIPSNTDTQFFVGGRILDIDADFFRVIDTLSERAISALMQTLNAGGTIQRKAIKTQSERNMQRAFNELLAQGIIKRGKGRYWFTKCVGLNVVTIYRITGESHEDKRTYSTCIYGTQPQNRIAMPQKYDPIFNGTQINSKTTLQIE